MQLRHRATVMYHLPEPQLQIEKVMFLPVAFKASPMRLYRSLLDMPSLKLQLSYYLHQQYA